MMAKMFYTLDEAKVALDRNEEEIKQLSREGRLREFRDGPRLMFKADQVDALKAELSGGGGGHADQIDLGPSDTGAPIGLVDSHSNSGIGSGMGSVAGSGLGSGLGSGIGSGIGSGVSLSGTGAGLSLADSEARGGTGTNISAGSGMNLKEDSDLAADLGLSGSLGGVPSPGRAGSGSGLSGLSGIGSGAGSGGGSGGAGSSGTGSRSGINVLGSDDSQADPMAQTSISTGVGDSVNLEGVGSGSGLLDLTRESDDTSLGAELLDEITPQSGGRRPVSAGDSSIGGVTATGVAASGRRGVMMPQQQESPDSLAPAFGGAALAAVLFVLYGTVILCSSILHTKPGMADFVTGKPFGIVAAIGAGAAIVFFIVGLFIGKATTR